MEIKRIKIISPKYGVHYALIDGEDFELVSKYKWCVSRHRNTFYAVCPGTTSRKAVLMHRLLLGFPDGIIDHKDRNGLNNQKSNLRPCSYKENSGNCKMLTTNKSGYRGVRRVINTGRYEAYITINNRFKCLGTFKLSQRAAMEYNKAAIVHFGEFASLNQIA